MFLLGISPTPPSPLPYGDPSANKMAASNKQNTLFEDLVKEAKSAQVAEKKAPPNPGFVRTLMNTIDNIFIPQIIQAQKLVLDAALKLNKESAVALSETEIQNIQKATTQQLSRPLFAYLRTIPEIKQCMEELEKKGLPKFLAAQRERKAKASTNPRIANS